MTHAKTDKPTQAQPQQGAALSAELHNERTHDSTVDTDGKNREAARLAGHGVIGPDEVTTSNATPDNSVPEADDGLAGFDSRPGGNRPLLALAPGYAVVEKGMAAADQRDDPFDRPTPNVPPPHGGRTHAALNHRRPHRIIELQRVG